MEEAAGRILPGPKRLEEAASSREGEALLPQPHGRASAPVTTEAIRPRLGPLTLQGFNLRPGQYAGIPERGWWDSLPLRETWGNGA